MATPASPQFKRLADIYTHLAGRSDVDNIVLELLGQFSLEKIYADADKETYQFLVITLLAQLTGIFWVQRLSLPAENHQVGWYLGFLVSWEVTLRAVEFVLQIVVEGRESLWEAKALRDTYLAEFLLSSLRVLTLHPKAPTNQRAKDRRDRFARIHGSLERLYDSYPGQKSFLLLVCKEISDSLRTEPNALALPTRLRYELPNVATDLYPLADVLSAQYVVSIVPQEGFSGDWLPQFLALRDVSHFVVGASIQYGVKRETRDFQLQSSSQKTRNAVLQALDNMRLPPHLTKADLVANFSDIFRIILPDTPNLARRNETPEDEYGWDAMDTLCVKLNDRQVVNRASDREMMHCISEVTRNIALLDDPSAQFRVAHPRLYSVNCRSCHQIGDSQLRQSGDIKFPYGSSEFSELKLLPGSKCPQCGEGVSFAREITLARQTWDLLKPLEPNSDAINVERHQPSQFQLAPPKIEAGMPFHSSFSSGSTQRHESDAFSPYDTQPFSERRSIPHSPLSTKSPELSLRLDTPQTGTISSGNLTSIDGVYSQTSAEARKNSVSAVDMTPFSPDSVVGRSVLPNIEHSTSTVSFEPLPSIRTRTVPLPPPSERKEPSSWRSKLTGSSRKQSFAASGDTSSLSSTTLEAQTLEEISLKSLIAVEKGKKVSSGRSKSGKSSIKVYLSQNSTHALFWTQLTIHIWDVGGPGPPKVIRSITAESTCVMACATKGFLAYVIGTRDQKLTLRIVNLLQPTAPAVEYRMPSALWCRSIAICPSENYVVVGFENALVRFFNTTNAEQPREDYLHRGYHKECKECPSVDTLSFSNDGLVLLASTRSKSGVIQIYQWRFPFLIFSELPLCRYPVPLHESEDAGISAAIFRSAPTADENLICITTWTQSGAPLLIQPADGHRSLITPSADSHHSTSRKVGSRIQAAAFSPSGRDLALVNDKGHVYVVSRLNSSPMDVTRVATSRELTAKADNFAMQFVHIPDEGEAVVLAWADASKGIGWIKKIPVVTSSRHETGSSPSQTPGVVHVMSAAQQSQQSQSMAQQQTQQYELPGDLTHDQERRPSDRIDRKPVYASGALGYGVYSGVYGGKLPMIDIKTPELDGDHDEILPAGLQPWEREPDVKFLVEEKKVVEKSKFRGRSSRP